MAKMYARGARAWGICGRSGRKMLLSQMIFDGRFPNMRVDPAWFEAKHPLETLPRVEDPIALYRPSPEVIAAPTAPVLAVVLVGSTAQLTWQPSETNITEIKSYDIYRGIDGATPTLLVNCPVRRDFLGGIISIDNCTLATLPEHPGDPWTNVIEDCPIIYVDVGGVTLQTEAGVDLETESGVLLQAEGLPAGHTYCYFVIANPLGNNQSTAQGPPSAPSNTACVTVAIIYQATPPVLSGALSGTNVVLNWTAATITGSTIGSYLLYRNVDAGAFSLFQTLGNVLTYTDTTTSVGHTYGYNVIGVPLVGLNSDQSNTVFETPVGGPLWIQVDGGIFVPGLQGTTGIVVLDTTHAVVSSDSGTVAITSDAGVSWTLITIGGGASFLDMATDGTHVVGISGGGATGKLYYSADQGSTWTDVTPGGFSANDGVHYFPGIGKFVVFDSNANPSQVATSTTGALGTWTVTAMPNHIVVTYFTGAAEANGALVIAGETGGLSPALLERSTDGNTWTTELSYNPGAGAGFQNLAYNGTVWDATGSDSAGAGHYFNYTSSDNGVTWTQRVVGPQSAPPFIDKQVALGSTFLTSNAADTNVGRSTDNGVSWSTVAVTGLSVSVRNLKIFSSKCYAFGDGVSVSPDGLTWTQELTLTAIGSVLVYAGDAGGAGGLTLAAGHDTNGNGIIYKRTTGV